MLLEEGACYDKCVLLAKLFSLLVFSLFPASFHISRPNLPVTPGVSRLPTFAYNEKDIFLGVSSKRSCRSS